MIALEATLYRSPATSVSYQLSPSLGCRFEFFFLQPFSMLLPFFFSISFCNIQRSAIEVMLLRRELHWAKEASFFDLFVQQILDEHLPYVWHLCKG